MSGGRYPPPGYTHPTGHTHPLDIPIPWTHPPQTYSFPPPEGTRHTHPRRDLVPGIPIPYGQTNTCENITFPQNLKFVGGRQKLHISARKTANPLKLRICSFTLEMSMSQFHEYVMVMCLSQLKQ